MNQTKNYGLKKPEIPEFFRLEYWNENLDKIDSEIKSREDKIEEIANTEFTVADKRENIVSKEKMPKILGKIAKFFTDLKTVAFTGNYEDLIDKPKYGKEFVTDKSGTLSINLDGETITLDQAKNVIKLADTLKDKINGAFPATDLINNLTTTEAGFGLDARQGKALNDKITEINGSLNQIELTSYGIEGIDAGSTVCFVKNKIAYITVNIYFNPKEAITGWTKILGNFPLPVNTKDFFIYYDDDYSSNTLLGARINGNGELLIIGSKFSHTRFICGAISYPFKQ